MSRESSAHVNLTLSRLDLGQVIEVISIRQEEWAETAEWHRDQGRELPKGFKEDSNEEEACWVAENYLRILRYLEKEMEQSLRNEIGKSAESRAE